MEGLPLIPFEWPNNVWTTEKWIPARTSFFFLCLSDFPPVFLFLSLISATSLSLVSYPFLRCPTVTFLDSSPSIQPVFVFSSPTTLAFFFLDPFFSVFSAAAPLSSLVFSFAVRSFLPPLRLLALFLFIWSLPHPKTSSPFFHICCQGAAQEPFFASCDKTQLACRITLFFFKTT